MRYRCLVYLDEDALAALPPGAQAALDAECRACRRALQLAQLSRNGVFCSSSSWMR